MNVRLVSYRPEFAERFIKWRSQPSSVRHNPLKPANKDEIVSWLERDGFDLSDLSKHESYRWFVEFDGEIVGNVSLKNINHMMSYAEIAYGIAEAHQGKGLATYSVKLLCQKAFAEGGLRKLIAFVHDKNIPSCRVMEKVGFKREGLLREHYLINGSPENEMLFGLLKHEWQPE